MPYLPTSQAFLEQSALLLEAYPDTTRITTKYNFPSQPQPQQQQQQQQRQQQTRPEPQQPLASLTLKTYNPSAGICLKYRTNKAAEVGRLITSLGKLAGGAGVAGLGLGLSVPAPVPAAAAAADVEMVDVPVESTGAATPKTTDTGAKGGKKKKGGKGKR